MALHSLKEAIRLLKTMPVLWLTGIAAGSLAAAEILLSVWGDPFYAERIWLLQILVLPFFVAGGYGVIRGGKTGISAYIQQGFAHYFQVLLPGILIFLAGILTVFLVLIPLTLAGISGDIATLTFVSAGVMIPILFFTFFYDTAAVMEDRKVFESLLRSVEFVFANPARVIIFFLSALAVFVAIGFAGMIVLAFALAGQLEPLTAMDQSQLESLGAMDLTALLGTNGILMAAAVYGAVVMLFTALLYPFKAVFYLSHTRAIPAAPAGEYDEKGRWFKY
ncbi:MAG: hypothetical protein GKC04_00210 [Methanomicrobiales archaeon]|nr:hypothetical protein [Methanomicrobiales archaeon]